MLEENIVISSKYGAYSAILGNRKPSAFSEIFTDYGEKIGKSELFVTPLGLAFSFEISTNDKSCPQKIYSVSIDGAKKELNDIQNNAKSQSSYRVKTNSLPSITVKCGKGYLTFFTDLFHLTEIIGRKITISDSSKTIGNGEIVAL